jgi:hypothetical protein
MTSRGPRISPKRLSVLIGLLLAVAGTGLLIQLQSSHVSSGSAAKPVAGLGDGLQSVVRPGQPLNEEKRALEGREAYFLNHFVGPNGNFDAKWLQQGQAEAANMQTGIPAGKISYDRSKSQSPMDLDPNALVSLGPQPAQSDGCWYCFNYGIVSGRINSVAIHPTDHSIVYLGVSNGGVWKTTNCCTEDTAWTPLTDGPMISTLTIDEVTLDPNDPDTIYVATGDFRPSGASRGAQGILKSTDAGASWTVLGEDVFVPIRGAGTGAGSTASSGYDAVAAVKVDPNNSDTLIAGTKIGYYMSYDAGANWTGPCYTNSYTNTLNDQRQDNTEILVRDDGATTTIYYAIGRSSSAQNGANGIYTATMPTGGSGCATGWNLITRGDNGWPENTGNGTPSASKPGRIDIAIAPSNPQIVYAAAEDLDAGGVLGIWRSTDGGATWEQRSETSNDQTVGSFPDCAGGPAILGQVYYDQTIEVDPNDPDVLYYGEVDGFKSTDGGLTWLNFSCVYTGGNYIHPDQHDYRYVPGSSSQMLFANDGGIWYTDEADVVSPTRPSIISLNRTLNTLEFYNGDTTGNFATGPYPGANGGTQDNGSFVNVWDGPENTGPETWQLQVGGDGFFAAIEPVSNNIWYQEQNNSDIWRSTNGPNGPYYEVTPIGPIPEFPEFYDHWHGDGRSFATPYQIYKYDCPPTGCTHLIAGTYRVWETIDGAVSASSWYTNSPQLTKTKPFPGWASFPNILQLSYAVSVSDTAVAGTSDGNFWYGFNLGQGTPESATWVNVTMSNTVLPNRSIIDSTTDPENPLIAYAALGAFDQTTPGQPGHVYQVTCTALCASATWVDKSGNLPNLPADSIVVNPNFRKQVFVGMDNGLFYTNDIDAEEPEWFRFVNGLPNVWVADLTVDRGFTSLIVWTRNRGAYAWPLPSAPFIQPTATPTVTGTPPTATPIASTTPVACYNTTVMTSTGASIIPATNDLNLYCDECETQVPLPFPVTFYGQTFSSAWVDANGWLTFGHPTAFFDANCIPNRNEEYTVHALAADLCTVQCAEESDPCEGCGVFYSTTGLAPNRQFVIEWRANYYAAPGRANFEIIFTEGSPDVSVIYGEVDYGGANASAGIQQTYNGSYATYSCGEEALAAGLRIDYLISECAATATPTATACPIQFQDVPPSNSPSSFYPYVRCLACRNIVGGYPCGDVNPVTGQAEPCGASGNAYYRPDNNITRGQIAKIVAQAAGYDGEAGPQIYADVPPDQVFWIYVQQLSNDHVMGGYPCGGVNPQTGEDEECDDQDRPYFRVNNYATRGQLAKIVANAAGLSGGGSGQTYSDVPPSASPSSFYPYIEELSSMGVMGGYKCGTSDPRSGPCDGANRPYFRPANNVTRGQAAKIVANTFFPGCQTPARP